MRIQCKNQEIHLIKHLISPNLLEAFENRMKNKDLFKSSLETFIDLMMKLIKKFKVIETPILNFLGNQSGIAVKNIKSWDKTGFTIFIEFKLDIIQENFFEIKRNDITDANFSINMNTINIRDNYIGEDNKLKYIFKEKEIKKEKNTLELINILAENKNCFIRVFLEDPYLNDFYFLKIKIKHEELKFKIEILEDNWNTLFLSYKSVSNSVQINNFKKFLFF